MPESYVRNTAYAGDDRVTVYVMAMNDDRVLYYYNHANRNNIGCVSRNFFDNYYKKLD